MREMDVILDAWAERERRGESAVLATVVDVKGSAYRRPGARMLIAADGARFGSISAGCLEGDVSQKAWWWTESGDPVVRIYDTTSDDDAVWEFGLGCNGVVRVLLERLGGEDSREAVAFLNACRQHRRPGVMATVIAAPGGEDVRIGERLLVTADGNAAGPRALREIAEGEARAALRERKSRLAACGAIETFIEVIAPPVPLVIFGAGHDAVPLVRLANEMGWHITVADGRPAYAKRSRLPLADEVVLTRSANPLAGISIERESMAVVMNHNYPVDRAILGDLLARRLPYVGVLGPRARTEKMLLELGIDEPPASLHAPIGLDIGADTPEAIALAVVAEIQAVLAGRAGGMLRQRTGSIYPRETEARSTMAPRAVA